MGVVKLENELMRRGRGSQNNRGLGTEAEKAAYESYKTVANKATKERDSKLTSGK